MTEVLYEVADHVATITLERSRADEHDLRGDVARHLRAAARGRPRSRRTMHRAHGRGPGVLCRARPAGADGGTRRVGSATSVARSRSPVSSNCATPRRSCCTTSTRRRSARSTAGPPGYGLDLALGLRHPHRRGHGQAQPRVRQARASCPRAAARGCCRGSSATPRRPRSRSPGRTLTADEALELGLVNQVVPAGELAKRAGELAGEIAANAPLAVRAIKRMMRAAETETFEQNVHHVFLQLLPLLKHRRLHRRCHGLHGEAAARIHRALSGPCRPSGRRPPTRSPCSTASRRPGRSVGTPPTRSPTRISPRSSGTPAARRRVRIVSRSGSSCCATAEHARAARALLGEAFRAGWNAKRDADGYRPSRIRRLDAAVRRRIRGQVPVVVLVCLDRYRAPSPVRGRLGVSGVPEPAARGAGARATAAR